MLNLGLAVVLVLSGTPAASPAETVALIAGQGAGDVNHTKERFGVHGTDLGVMWRDGRGRTAIAFGDTYGQGWGGHGAGPDSADWRLNTLAHSSDTELSDGLSIDDMVTDRPSHAKQLLGHDPAVPEVTVIPTAGVSVGSRDYLHYMSVRSWATGGRWTTNYSGLAYSDDGGSTWTKDPAARWPNSGGAARFQLGAFVRRDGFVYLFGTPDGRLGDAYLARVPETALSSLSAYEYWTATGWRPDSSAAVPVLAGQTGEPSVQYNDFLGRWIALHLDESRYAIVLRTAPAPTGPWTGGQVVAAGTDHPGLYGAFLHPASNADLYFAMSEWDPYHVRLMRLRLPGFALDPNLAQDGGFEDATLGPWRPGGNAGLDRGLGFARSGVNNGWLHNTSGWNELAQHAVLQPGARYRLSGWLRSSANTTEGYFGLRAGNIRVERKFGSLPGYTQLTVEFTAPAAEAEIYAGAWATGGQETWARVDDVELEKVG
ncbi:hypothetical protein BS329_41490 [Amycolatopsis coloradensis]|uniref:DUF4185 domain-containing protein n=1 Tax=Amycolatopsis coloradensis TaxID=76021 RepID=A0A1R0KD70_9PSEU|nr:hypothetical protein BS329_41490 [Amycolatopsis coloradensis]